MLSVKIADVGKNYIFKWPGGQKETYHYFVEYTTKAEDGRHVARLGFCERRVYGKDRIRIVIWIDEHPHAEFLGADDFKSSGEVLSEIKIPGQIGERICRYPRESVPERYAMFSLVGLPRRVKYKGVHKAWAVVANIADHRTLIALAGLKRLERRK